MCQNQIGALLRCEVTFFPLQGFSVTWREREKSRCCDDFSPATSSLWAENQLVADHPAVAILGTQPA